MFNQKSQDSKFALVAAGVFALLVFPRAFAHEMWRDEWQAWLLAKDSGSLFHLLFVTLRFECYPGLWHALLWFLNFAGFDASSMQVLNATFATGTIYVFNRFAPLSRGFRVIFSCGYFPFYEYAVIARCYSLEFLLLFTACALFRVKTGRGILLAVVLAAMAQTHIFAAAVTGSFVLAILCDWWLRSRGEGGDQNFRSIAAPVGFGFVGVGLSFIQTWPPRGPSFEIQIEFLARLGNAFRGAFLAFCPLPMMESKVVTHYGLWNSSIIDGMIGAQSVLGFLCCLAALVVLARRPAAALFFAATMACMLWLFGNYTGSALRHFGHLFFAFIGGLCIAPYCAPIPADWKFLKGVESLSVKRFARTFLLGTLTLHVVACAYMCVAELKTPFSGAKAAADIINQNVLSDTPVVADIDYAGSAVAGYLGRPVYYLGRRQMGSYIIWDGRRLPGSVPPAEMVPRIEEYLNLVRRDIVLIVNYSLNVGPDVGVLLGRATPAIVADEQFLVFRIKYGAKFAPAAPDPR